MISISTTPTLGHWIEKFRYLYYIVDSRPGCGCIDANKAKNIHMIFLVCGGY